MQNLESFINLYSLTKVVKFELCPIPQTMRWMNEFGRIFTDKDFQSEDDNFFITDLKIDKAKRIIQDVLNAVHENIINSALTSKEIKKIDISTYYALSIKSNHNLDDEEKRLRELIEICFEKPLKRFYDILQSKKDSNKEKKRSDYVNVLGDAKMLDYLKNNAKNYVSIDYNKTDIEKACDDFKGYWGLLSQYIENRKNYYIFDKEQDTSVATRIVSDILPVFCKNCKQYASLQTAYDAIEGFNSSIFTLADFHKYISQAGIESYNKIISSNNTFVNLYNQQQVQKSKRINEFIRLHKQIGCKETGVKELPQICKDWESTESETMGISLEAKLWEVIQLADKIIAPKEAYMHSPCVYNLISWLKDVETWDGLYISDKALRTISSRYLDDWFSLEQLLVRDKSVGTYNNKKEPGEQFKLNSAVELKPVFLALDTKDFDSTFKKDVYEKYKTVLDRNLPLSRNLINMYCYDIKQKVNADYPEKAQSLKALLTAKLTKEQKEGYFQQEESIDIIRDYLDCILSIVRNISFFSVRQNKIKGAPYNMKLLQIVSSLLDTELGNRRKWYDEVRNYVLRLPQDDVKDNKLKLNFKSSSLLKGWSVGQEETKLSLLLKKNDIYYLCILKNEKECKKLFEYNTEKQDKPIYGKGEQDGAFRMLMRDLSFRTLVGKGYVAMHKVKYSEEDDAKAILHAQQLIQQNYLKNYPLLDSVVNRKYKSKSEFQADVEAVLRGYAQCQYTHIDWRLVERYANEGMIYVFRIHSKDYKGSSKGKRDLQTIYWEDVLSGNSQHQLAAYGEIFRREAISPEKRKPVRHLKGSSLVNKHDVDGNSIPDNIYNIAYSILNNKDIPKNINEKDKERAQLLIDKGKIVYKEAWMDIIKDARFYDKAKYYLHNPISLNYTVRGFDGRAFSVDAPYYEINPIIQEAMHSNGVSPSFIGIDRGEKHLIYACKINNEGVILSCDHYDKVNGIDYLKKLEERATTRLEAKQSWKQQESIKNLKDGYISHVVHELLTDTIPLGSENEIPSYIVLEKLSREMKRGRQKIEKQVYQKFELALANKLNFYVCKDVEEGRPGSVQMPLQFVPPVRTFEQIDKKDSFGIMLYSRPNYTSVTDPLTGWRKTVYITSGTDKEIFEQLYNAFIDIRFDGKDYVFSYEEQNIHHRWDMYSGISGKSLDRFEYSKIKKQYVAYNIVNVLHGLFIDFDKSESLLEQMKNGVKLRKTEPSRTAYESLRKAINMIQQIRNTGNKVEDDNFLQSPIRKEGKHFDTRHSEEFGNLKFIVDADANGAYNIARKGLIMDAHYRYWLEHGKPTIKSKKEASALSWYVSDREWDMWLLDRDAWNRQLSEFALRLQD